MTLHQGQFDAVTISPAAHDAEQYPGDSLRMEEALRAARAQLWGLSAQHLQIQESERRRIAAELHDGLGQMLTLVRLSIEHAASSANAGDTANLGKTLQRLSSEVKSAVDELRRIAMNLRPSTLDQLGIVATLAWYFREIQAASPGLQVVQDVAVSEADVPEPLKIAIFRIVQEATSNVLKYAKAGRVRVQLGTSGGTLKLLIEDDGEGFDPASAAGKRDEKHGLGLLTMKERAEVSGGIYDMQSMPGRGTRISVSWRRVPGSDAQCPVIPISQTLAQSRCMSVLDAGEASRNFSVCVTCVRALSCDSGSQAASQRCLI